MAKRQLPSSSSEALKKLEEQLTCPVCEKRFEQPRMLPCLHSFCLRCLAIQRDDYLISCPSCRQQTPLPSKDPAKFPPAFIVNNLLGLHKLLQVSGSKQTSCDKCRKGQAASYCKQCALFLCQTCVDQHNMWIDHHKLTGVEDVASNANQLILPQTMNCDTHSKSLDIYCENCDQLICHDCIIKLHRAHNYDLVAEIFPKHKQQIQKELQPVKQQQSMIDAALHALDERIDQISDQGQEVEQQIHTTAQQAIKTLQETERQLREEVKTGVQQKLQELKQQKKEVESNQTQLNDCQEFVEEALRIGSQQQVEAVKCQMVEHMRAVRSRVTLQPVEEANITFTVDSEVLSQCHKLGEVNSNLNIASQIVTKGKGTELAMAGKETSIELTVLSQSTSSTSLPFKLISSQLTASNSSQPVECTITPTQPGSYTIHYTATARGTHKLRITVGGSDIPSSPFTVHVLPTLEMRGHQLDSITGLNEPYDVAVSANGEVIVSERRSHCVSVFSREWKKMRSIGTEGSYERQFNEPRGVALTRDGYLLVADGENHRIQVLTLDGDFVKSLGQMGKGPLQFNTPRLITVHPTGKVFIADTDNHRIQVLNSDFSFSHMFGYKGNGQGQFNYPTGVACDSHGYVYVADSSDHPLQKFTSEGQFISFSCEGYRKCQLNHPAAICIDSTDTLYVSDLLNDRVAIFDSEGQFLKCFSGQGREEGKLNAPRGLAVDNTGNLFVCDYGNHRVVIY